MKSKEKEKKPNIDETVLSVEVESDVIEGVRNGDIRLLELESKEDELNLRAA